MNRGGISLTATVAWALSHTFPIDFYLVFQFLKFIFSPIKKYYMYLHETTNSESLDKFVYLKVYSGAYKRHFPAVTEVDNFLPGGIMAVNLAGNYKPPHLARVNQVTETFCNV